MFVGCIVSDLSFLRKRQKVVFFILELFKIINYSYYPLMSMIYIYISLSPAKHPNEWVIAKLRLNKNFHDGPLLCKSHRLVYPNECTELFICFYALLQDIYIEF